MNFNIIIIKINGLQLDHLKLWQFWWIFKSAFKSLITKKNYFIGCKKWGTALEIGGKRPINSPYNKGLIVRECGHIFGKRIIYYEDPKTVK